MRDWCQSCASFSVFAFGTFLYVRNFWRRVILEYSILTKLSIEYNIEFCFIVYDGQQITVSEAIIYVSLLGVTFEPLLYFIYRYEAVSQYIIRYPMNL